jgi:hypothetical protein
MDRPRAATRSTDVTVVLAVLALLLAAAAIWAGTSFAGGSGNSPSQGGGIVQSDDGIQREFAQEDGDCPERNGDRGQNGEQSPEDSL